jgi:hypothetical protein
LPQTRFDCSSPLQMWSSRKRLSISMFADDTMDTKKLCYICLRITSKPIQYCRYPASPGEETVGGQTRGVESLMSHLFHWRAAVCWRCRRMLLGFRALLLVVTAVVVVQFSGAPNWHDWLQLGLRSHLNVCTAHCTVNACGLSSRSLCTARAPHTHHAHSRSH